MRKSWILVGILVALATAAVIIVLLVWEKPVNSSLTAKQNVPTPPKLGWWATYAGMKYAVDDNDPQLTAPITPKGFFRKYPDKHRKIWEMCGIDSDAVEHRVFSITPIASRLNRLLEESAFAWPTETDKLAMWWQQDVLSPIIDTYGDYLSPRSLNNAELDGVFRNISNRPSDTVLTDEDRRIAIFDVSQKLLEKYHDNAATNPQFLAVNDEKLRKVWFARKVLK